jgi:hypothetical protein
MGKYGSAVINKEIKATSAPFQDCIFYHEGRASSFEAHNLAKHVLSEALGRRIFDGLVCQTL